MNDAEVTTKRGKGRPSGSTNVITPITHIVAELQAGKTAMQIAAGLGCSVEAVYSKCRRAGFSVVAVRSYQARKADLFAWKQQQIIESMSLDKIEKASLRDQATSLNILHNAERLERGQSTNNVSFADMTRELEELDAEELRLRNLLSVQVPPAGGPKTEGTD